MSILSLFLVMNFNRFIFRIKGWCVYEAYTLGIVDSIIFSSISIKIWYFIYIYISLLLMVYGRYVQVINTESISIIKLRRFLSAVIGRKWSCKWGKRKNTWVSISALSFYLICRSLLCSRLLGGWCCPRVGVLLVTIL